jgi:glycosyltransferase involved in cell wall biosynthesis
VTPRPLLDALRILRAEDAELAERVEVVFAGPLTDDERSLLAASDLDGTVRAAGWMERPRALRLQRAADSLLLLTEGSARRSVATGKLYEYLQARRPVLVLGEETEAARIVVETGTGLATSTADPRAIAGALGRFIRREDLPEPHEDAIERFSWAHLAEEYSRLIGRICAADEPTR